MVRIRRIMSVLCLLLVVLMVGYLFYTGNQLPAK